MNRAHSFQLEHFASLSHCHLFLQRKTTNLNTTRSFIHVDNLKYGDHGLWVRMMTNCQLQENAIFLHNS